MSAPRTTVLGGGRERSTSDTYLEAEEARKAEEAKQAEEAGARRAAPAAADLPRDRVRRVQRRLAALGLAPGPADGVLGGRTRSALRGFQQGRGLAPTGEPDQRTLRELGAE